MNLPARGAKEQDLLFNESEDGTVVDAGDRRLFGGLERQHNEDAADSSWNAPGNIEAQST